MLNCALIQVCDSILNIGPCANASMGEPAFLSEEVNTVSHALRPSLSLLYLEISHPSSVLPTVPGQPRA